MIPWDVIHKRVMDTKWRSLEDRGMVRSFDAEENKRRLRESRLDPEDIESMEPEKLSRQATITSRLYHTTKIQPTTVAPEDTVEMGSSPAPDSTSINTPLINSEMENV